jgi:hypothetical protein
LKQEKTDDLTRKRPYLDVCTVKKQKQKKTESRSQIADPISLDTELQIRLCIIAPQMSRFPMPGEVAHLLSEKKKEKRGRKN